VAGQGWRRSAKKKKTKRFMRSTDDWSQCYEPVPTFIVNLDLPQARRWDEVSRAYAPVLRQVVVEFEKQLLPALVGSGPLAAFLYHFVQLALFLVCFFDGCGWIVPHAWEIWGMSRATGIACAKLVAAQYVYEVSTCCTSVVVTDAGTDRPVHLRTMDFQLDFDVRPLTIRVHFTRRGKTVATAATWAGYVGLLTAVRIPSAAAGSTAATAAKTVAAKTVAAKTPRTKTPRTKNGGGHARDRRPARATGFSVSVNYRESSGINQTGINMGANSSQTLGGIARLRWPVGAAVRHVIFSRESYAEAVVALEGARLVVPCYFIVAGPRAGEGVVITREAGSSSLAPNRLADAAGFQDGEFDVGFADFLDEESPALVQCNTDWTKCDVLGDMVLNCATAHGRKRSGSGESAVAARVAEAKRLLRTAADVRGSKTGGHDERWRFLSTPPIRNEVTIYATLMRPWPPEGAHSAEGGRRTKKGGHGRSVDLNHFLECRVHRYMEIQGKIVLYKPPSLAD
jgi:hypothetical protein